MGTTTGLELVVKNDTVDFLLYQGKTLSYDFTIYTGSTTSAPRNLTGYKARLKARKSLDGDALFTFESTASPATITFPSATAGVIRLTQTATNTATYSGCGVYDFEIESSGGDVDLLMRGGIKIIPEVTK